MSKKTEALEKALQAINKDFGAGTVAALGDSVHMDVESFSTGSLNLDMALGIGGLPSGRVVEIYGPEASGKTTVALHTVASAQKAGKVCCFIDVEHARSS